MPGSVFFYPLIECVPNFSEGRDGAKIAEIAGAISEAGAAVLRVESDPDHNRSVITFAGDAASIGEAAFRAIGRASELIDLKSHRGVHPRLGACDVVPFVPLRDATLEDCARIARETGERVWKSLGIPVYFYESAALRPEAARLENVRRGQFEAPKMAPDLGGLALHLSAGAVILGARKILVAFNVNLDTSDVHAARRIARKIRASNGGLPGLKAMGVYLESRKLAQVSMNLVDTALITPQRAFDAVQAEAAALGVDVRSTQLVGLIPESAVDPDGEAFRLCEDFGSHRILECALEKAFRLP